MGGALFNRGGVVTIKNSTLSQNKAQGGYTYGNVATVDHSLGSAIFNLDGTLIVQFSTLANNLALQPDAGPSPRMDGGAIFNKQVGGSAILRLDNSILADTQNNQTDFFNDGGLITGSQSNIVEINGAGANGLPGGLLLPGNGNPLLGPLANNG